MVGFRESKILLSNENHKRGCYGYGWWADEQPSDEIKADVEQQLETCGWKVDKSTEKWLGTIEAKLEYQKWYCGHYHTEKKIDKLELMFENVDRFLE